MSAKKKIPRARRPAGDPPSAGTGEATAPVGVEERAPLDFPVIGIGASAGGLEAFSRFFENMPADSGMAFVLILHLPPERDSLVADILGRKTSMPVHQVEPDMQLERNTVYVIRPGHTLTISQGRLKLGESVDKKGHRRPVDDFFRSLAAEQKEKAIVIVMSGMGSNGTAGAQAVKAAGGICIAQDPDTAEFPSMPRTVIDTAPADFVAAPEAIPQMLLSYTQHPYYRGDDGAAVDAVLQPERHHVNEILAILRAATGRDYSGYRKPTLVRRIQRRMGLAQITSLSDYVEMLRNVPAEASELNTDLAISVTGFFRDAPAWEALHEKVITPLMHDRESFSQLRCWVAGCSSGEEAYTMAMLLAEEAHRQRKRFDIKIFATDTADRLLGQARAGIFPGGIEGDISQERLDRFFEKDDHVYGIRKEIREMVVFAPQNVLTDPPFSRLDLCSCRNLLIYLEPPMQRQVISILHFSLREEGCLFLGNSETLGPGEDLFETVDRKWRIYRRIGSARGMRLPHPGAAYPGMQPGHAPAKADAEQRPGFMHLVQKAVSERHGAPLVVVDGRQRVVYFQGPTARYLAQHGEPTRNVLEMMRDPLRSAVRSAVREVFAKNRTVTTVSADGGNGSQPQVRVTAAPLGDPRVPDHFVISFETVAKTAAASAGNGSNAGRKGAADRAAARVHSDALEVELGSVREELQGTIEELESSNEELKASNEEVTSINEELQSTNEELETSKEELQSLNEELTTVNNQLQAKIEELEATTNDLSNLLSSTDIAVVFLDTALRVRRSTPAMSDLLELIPSDVGRPVVHLAQKFEGANIVEAAQRVLDKLIPVEAEVCSHTGRWYACRALPYRTADNRIDGVVLTFVDITQRKRAVDVSHESQARLQAALEQLPAAVLVAEAPSGRLVLGNHQAAVLFGHPYPLPFLDSEWAAAYVAFKGFHASGRPYQRDEWPLAKALSDGTTIVDEEIRFVRSDGSRGTMSASAAAMHDAGGAIIGAVATFWDISDRTEAEQRLRESEQRFRLVVEGAKQYAIIMLDAEGTIVTWNSGAQAIFGYADTEAIGQTHRIFYGKADQAQGAPQRRLSMALGTPEGLPEEGWMVKKDGEAFWCSGTITALRSESGTHRGFLKVLRDATDQQRQQAGLQQAKTDAEVLRDAAEAANRAKDEFVATVSHELRTPLTAILLWARLLRDSKMDSQAFVEGVATIERAARAQQQLVDDLLDVSRIASGKLRLSLRNTRLATALEASLDAVKPAAEARGVSLEAEVSRDVGVVRADPDRVQQIVWNLLSNGVKFTPAGGSVKLNAWREGSEVIIKVTDTGIGIHRDFMPYLFDRFRQANVGTTRDHSGLGLGLAIARQLTELHGGTLSGDSDGEGKGASFSARLPLIRLQGAGDGVEPAAQIAPDLKGRTVLLVEDEEVSRDAINAFLRAAGADVVAVSSAKAALGVLAQRSFDMIVTDIAMPGMDGYAMVRELRQREQQAGNQPTPALALSAFARQEDQRRATEAGFHAYLVKPVEGDRLISVLSGLISED